MRTLFLLFISIFLVLGCNNPNKKSQQKEEVQTNKSEIYEANIESLNSNITNLQTSGKARFVIEGEKMHVTISIDNAPPGIEHWQHFHGFTDDKHATCASINEDANNDGIIDVIETETVSGTTMVPFNKLPAEMIIPTDTYPVADENGSYRYEVEIPLEALKTAFAEAFGGTNLNLDSRVIYIHCVASESKLPETVASIGDILVRKRGAVEERCMTPLYANS